MIIKGGVMHKGTLFRAHSSKALAATHSLLVSGESEDRATTSSKEIADETQELGLR
jgi:hypothetical protein